MERGKLMNALSMIDVQDDPPLGLDLRRAMSFDDWLELGRRLCSGAKVVNWWIGDWWSFGSHRYGARAEAAAKGIFGREFQTLANLASVCRSFETSRRREHLTWTHHVEVAALEPEAADELLDKAEASEWSTRDLRREVMRRRSPPTNAEAEQPKPLPAIETMPPDEIIVELAEALGRERALTERESLFLEQALRRLNRQPQDEWTAEQDMALVRLADEGGDVREVARALVRTEDAIRSRIRELRKRNMIGYLQRGPVDLAREMRGK